MARVSTKENKNIYHQTRESLKLTREAASALLACSDIPFECPISEVRVARINGEYVIDPTFEQMKEADMDLMVGASAENIMMVEGEMKEVSEQDLLGGLELRCFLSD